MGEEGQISIQVDSFDIFPKQQLSLHIPHYLLRPVFYFGAIGLCRILNQGIFDNYCSYVPRARNCETMGRFLMLWPDIIRFGRITLDVIIVMSVTQSVIG